MRTLSKRRLQWILSKIFREKGAWKGNEHITPKLRWLVRKKTGVQSGVRHYRYLSRGEVLFSSAAEAVALSCYWESTSRAEGKLTDGRTDKKETVRSQVCAALCKHTHSQNPANPHTFSHPPCGQLPLLRTRGQSSTRFRFAGPAWIRLSFTLPHSRLSVLT